MGRLRGPVAVGALMFHVKQTVNGYKMEENENNTRATP